MGRPPSSLSLCSSAVDVIKSVGPLLLLGPNLLLAQAASSTQLSDAYSGTQSSYRLELQHSWNPFNAYKAIAVPHADLANSPRLEVMIHDGVLQLSLKDAISLALENNLDLAIARYNLPIAEADISRTKAGGVFRGVNTGIIQNTPGGGVGGFGSDNAGAGAGGTTGGAGGAGTGASGLVQSTLGTGTAVASYDPELRASGYIHHYTEPLSNISIYGVQVLHENTIAGNFNFSQAFPTGTSVAFTLENSRATTNSPYTFLSPELDAYYRVELQQQLLAGSGFTSNLRYLRIARNNKRISNQAFALQVITTITQIGNMYWDLVTAYQNEKMQVASLDYANNTLLLDRKQLELEAIPALDVLKAEGEVAKREQEVSIARSKLRLQELLVKNAITRSLDDPVLESMPVRPMDLGTTSQGDGTLAKPDDDPVGIALSQRLELAESSVDLDNRAISRRAARDALLPSLQLTGYYGGTGLGGIVNPASSLASNAPQNNAGALNRALSNSSPDYYVGLSLDIPIRNRVAKSDQYRSELESRQAELRMEELRKQIRIEVRNAQYALEQSKARVTAAMKSRDLAQNAFEILAKEQMLGAGSALQTLVARHELATAESDLVEARTANRKARIEFDRATGITLRVNHIVLDADPQ